MKWKYVTLNEPTDDELNTAGERGWEVYATDGQTYKLKKAIKNGI